MKATFKYREHIWSMFRRLFLNAESKTALFKADSKKTNAGT